MRELPGRTGTAHPGFAEGYVETSRPAPSGRPWVLADFVVCPDGSATDANLGARAERHLFLRYLLDTNSVTVPEPGQ